MIENNPWGEVRRDDSASPETGLLAPFPSPHAGPRHRHAPPGGFGFLVGELDFREFFASPRWRPTSEWKTTYGILALIAGTASVTGLAMVVATPFSLGAAIYIAEFATGKTRETLKVLVELLAAIPCGSARRSPRSLGWRAGGCRRPSRRCAATPRRPERD